MFSPSSIRRLLFAFLLIAAVPFSASAAAVLSTPDDTPVSRAEFIRTSITVLKIPLAKGVTGNYERSVPKSMQPYIGAAEKYSAVELFGPSLGLARNITRGEAVQVLVKLQKLSPRGVQTTFGDIEEGTDLAKAVQVAVERNWMKPVNSTIFGAQRALTGREGRELLENVTGLRSTIETGNNGGGTVPVATIKVKSKEVQQLPENDLLRTVWQLLKEQYLYSDNIVDREAAYDAAEALVNSLKDQYTTFMRPTDSKFFQEQINGEVSGIGAQVEYRDNALFIVAPLTGSPAEKAGLKPGDFILSIDGVSLAGLEFLEAVAKVRGEKGSKAVLRIRRNGTEFDVTLTRNVIRVPEIDISFQGNVAIVKLVQFGQTTDRELRTLLAEVQTQKPKGLVLDLRNNPGGLLHAAEIVISNFVPKGSGVAIIKSREQDFTQVTVDAPTIDPAVKVVVLVNKGSASASEIVAGALQDAKRATILGEKTFGKGTVQQIIEFRDGSSMKMTIAEWLTPKGRKINGAGVIPDVEVAASDVRDEQLLRAINLLR